ncbi:hypothetical protein [Sulfobacillus harzensis]|uniref:Uncharacterized protein n=1 Tax=Sulfobacillus harzensis TaxID=2729629 RepID=A0A7Y0Q3N9_9FIRM|nr:hypothetical protein [Sulfobacillus harzensis]NMP24468.1 hypothetical protein [Sulfobacillus harzensis]
MFDIGHMHLLASTTNLGATKAGQTIKSLVTNTGGWVAGLGIPAGGLMIGYHAIMRNLSGGEAATDAHHLQAMKKVLVGTAIVAGAGGLAHFAGGLF